MEYEAGGSNSLVPKETSFQRFMEVRKIYNVLSVVQKTCNPLEGLLIDVISPWVIRGISSPPVVELMSSIAELSGGLPVVLMLTWLNMIRPGKKAINPDKKKTLTVVFMGN